VIPVGRLVVGAGATALAVALVLGAQSALAGAASADDSDGMLISLDGSSWSSTPAGSLFPAGYALVPGGSMDADVSVKNNSKIPAYLLVSIADASGSTLGIMRDLSLLATTASTPTSTPVALDAAAECNPLLSGEVLQPGAISTVHLALAMSTAADNTAMGAVANARLRVSLIDARAGSDGTVDCADLGGSNPAPVPSDGSEGGTDAGTAAPAPTSGGSTSGASRTVTRSSFSATSTPAAAQAGPAPITLPLTGEPGDQPRTTGTIRGTEDLPTLAIPGGGRVHTSVAGGLWVLLAGILGALFLFVMRKRRRADASE
jgi:hypothetical protein